MPSFAKNYHAKWDNENDLEVQMVSGYAVQSSARKNRHKKHFRTPKRGVMNRFISRFSSSIHCILFSLPHHGLEFSTCDIL
jgi:hypothetical protein